MEHEEGEAYVSEEGSASSDESSLFGSSEDESHDAPSCDIATTFREVPIVIPGLFFFPDLMDDDLQDQTLDSIVASNYFNEEKDQVMLFGSKSDSQGGLPKWSKVLLSELERRLIGKIPKEVQDLIFPPEESEPSRQMIINAYSPGQGISSHVDLLRFADGIIICSFLNGIAMELERGRQRFSLWLPAGSVLILSAEARYEWKHGISARQVDRVQESGALASVRTIPRLPRVSVTIRSMSSGGDIVGEAEPLANHRV